MPNVNDRAEDLESAAQNPVDPATQGGRKRRKWTRDDNKDLIRAYLIATRNELDMTAYRNQLVELWHQKHPNFTIGAQRLSDQVRSIFRRKVLSQAEIEAIKQEVTQELGLVVEVEAAQQANLQNENREHLL